MRRQWNPPRHVQRELLAVALRRAPYSAAEAALMTDHVRALFAAAHGLPAPDRELWHDVCTVIAKIERLDAA